MNKKEFIEKHLDGVHPAYYTKSWITIVKLEKEDRLEPIAFFSEVIKDIELARMSGRSKEGIALLKKNDVFVYEAIKEKCVRLLAEAPTNFS